MTTRSSDVVQAGLILVCGTGTAVAGRVLSQGHPGAQQLGVEGMLGLGLSLLGLGVVGFWFLTLTLAIATEFLIRRGRSGAARFIGRFTPTLMRRLAVALLGVNLLAVPAMAHAAPSIAATGAFATVEVLADRDDVSLRSADSPSPDRAATDPAPVAVEEAAAPAPVSPAWRPAPLPVDGGLLLRQETRTERRAVEVVVAPGDSLWSITADHLGPLATAADVAAAWPAWYEANRGIIGDDPSHVIPGQILQAPPP